MMVIRLLMHWIHTFSRRACVLGVLLSLSFFVASGIRATDPVQELQDQINETNKMLEMSVNATKPLESEVKALSTRIQSALKNIATLQAEQKQRTADIATQEKVMAGQYEIFTDRVDRQYRFARTNPMIVRFLNNSHGFSALKYTETLAERDRQTIDSIGEHIVNLQTAKTEAAKKEQQLASLQSQLNKQKASFEKDIAGAKQYQTELRGKIANLSARQQSIISEKTGTANTSVGDIPLVGDPKSRPDYNPGFSPAFAVFSFGAPHYKGMSQYGAWGRAKSGQNEEEILKAYYGNIKIETVDTGGNINTSSGSMSFEDRYLMGIAEMPSGWDDNNLAALKAQVIAARTYALSYVGWRMDNRNMSGSICTTEQCQVWNSGKAGNVPDTWRRAVNETKGKVVVSNNTNNIFATWYASTSGGHSLSYTSLGHTTPALWDTTSSWNNWVDGAYEKKSGSPWFYMAWYKTRGGDTCGRSHPWLTQEEFSDILNAWVVRRNASGGDLDRVSPLGGCWGGNPYSMPEMRAKAAGYGEEYTSVSGVRTEHNNEGNTSNVILQTNRGEVKISGSEFKETFNLRAPGRISLKGKLFGIEKK
jgi:peptidoglycan hydrolase-like amidase